MITEDYVSFETAKLLKEKGFNEPCRGNYYWDFDDKDNSIVAFGEWTAQAYKNDFEDEVFICSAPTLQMVMKWLREKGWVICVIPLTFYCGEKASSWGYNIWAGDNIEIGELDTPEFNTYEEACESAIRYCLENIE